jgi:hypothetical protein
MSDTGITGKKSSCDWLFWVILIAILFFCLCGNRW